MLHSPDVPHLDLHIATLDLPHLSRRGRCETPCLVSMASHPLPDAHDGRLTLKPTVGTISSENCPLLMTLTKEVLPADCRPRIAIWRCFEKKRACSHRRMGPKMGMSMTATVRRLSAARRGAAGASGRLRRGDRML